MTSLDADEIRRFINDPVRERLATIDVFAEVESTNSFLMQSPGPEPGMISIAATNNQTAGRGRHGKTWLSPPGSGLCLSVAYTFSTQPENLPALTLVLGLGGVHALEELGATDVGIKWPNDLVARDGKLGGILTEVQQQSAGGVTIITGIGINVDLQNKLDFGMETDWARKVVDLKSICDVTPGHEEIAECSENQAQSQEKANTGLVEWHGLDLHEPSLVGVGHRAVVRRHGTGGVS